MPDFGQFFEFSGVLPILGVICMLPMYVLMKILFEATDEWDLLLFPLMVGYVVIVTIYGWLLDPILLFSQLLLLVYAVVISSFYALLKFKYYYLINDVKKD